jgi:hypothetical protein
MGQCCQLRDSSGRGCPGIQVHRVRESSLLRVRRLPRQIDEPLRRRHPARAEGLSIIAHELTHALQDQGYNGGTPFFVKPFEPNIRRKEYNKEARKHGLRRDNFFEWLAYNVQERVLCDLSMGGVCR